MRISAELRDHEAAGSLAEELPYWGWLEDGRTCLPRTGELIAAGRLEPAVVDGRSPEQIDRVLGRWQRLLSGLDADTRLYFYMLRRPASPEAADDESSGIVAVSQRKRRAFLAGRVQQLEAYLVWSHDPRLRTVVDGPRTGSASRLMQWWKRRRASAQARANLLQDLYCLDAAMTVSLEWRPWAVEAARRRIRGAQRHYFARRYSTMAHVQETEGTAAAMVDSAAATESRERSSRRGASTTINAARTTRSDT